jgi:mRNA interferase RelE/StbE
VKVEYESSFLKDLDAVQDNALRQRVKRLILRLEAARSLREVGDVKKMHGKELFYRVRLGRYRVGIALEGAVVVLVRLLPRKDIYRYFP